MRHDMRYSLALTVVASLAVLDGAARGAEKRAVTIDDVLNLKRVGAATISPDGSRVLFTVSAWEWPGGKGEPDKGDKPPEMRSHVWVVSARGDAPPRQLTFGERGESAPQWSPDGTKVSFAAARGSGAGEDAPRPQIWIMAADGGEAWKLTDAKEGVGQYAWSPDGKRIAYAMRDPLSKDAEEKRKRKDDARVFESDFQNSHLWSVDLDTKTADELTHDQTFTAGAMSWSPDGARIAFSARPTTLIRDEREDILIVDLQSKALQKIAATAAVESAPAWSPDGRTIAYLMTPISGAAPPDGMPARPLVNARLMLFDVSGKQVKDVSHPQFDHNVSAPRWTPDSRRLLFTIGARAYVDVFAYDVASGRYSQATKEKTIGFGGTLSAAGSRVAFTMDSPRGPGDVYVSDAAFSSPRKLTTMNPQVADFTLGEAEVITWKSDGLDIEGMLLKPSNYQPGRKYPLLVDVHGGPTGAHVNRFAMDGQYWAGQGWAVLFPNPRGSSNYGEKFMRANIPDWGGGDYRDIMAGVDAAIARGIADPEKLAVMGWSYGGYMTCWVVSQTPRFKAAMMGAGLSNIASMYGTTDIPGYLGVFYKGYPTKETIPLYMERSGITHVDRVTTPLLILHGANDERVPIGQPMEFYRALKDRGKTVELVFYPREGHGLGEYYHQRDRLRRQFEWIAKYTLAPDSKKTSVEGGR